MIDAEPLMVPGVRLEIWMSTQDPAALAGGSTAS